ncbi:MAG: carbohydrate ABC transporter permease, partial [Actinomycetota bacterium]
PNLVSPLGVFLLRQYMKSAVPDELIDAARVDGAGHFRIYWKVVMPLSKPALAALAIFNFQFFWEDLYGPLIIISNPDLYTLPLGLALFQVGNRTVWNLVMAGSVLATIPIIIVFLIFQRQFVRGISLSGLKG